MSHPGHHFISSSSRFVRGKIYSTSSPLYDIYGGTLDNKPVFAQTCRLVNPQTISRQESDGFIQTLSKLLDIWAKCNHRNIILFKGIHMVDDRIPSLLIPGYTNGFAKQYLANNPRCNLLRLVSGVAEGLKYIHALGPPIIHQDVRAKNVLVNDNGEGCLTAIGTSLIHHPCSMDIDPIQLASPWIAPEVLRLYVRKDDGGQLVMTPESDVYSFGMTVLEIFSGRPPFHEKGPYASVIDAQNEQRRLRLDRSIYLSIPDDVWSLILRCTSEEPSERPNMCEVVCDINRMIGKS